MITGKIEGMEDVMKNLNKVLEDTRKNSIEGLVDAAISVQREMESASPKTPVDTGNLRSSQFVVANDGKVAVGNSATFQGEDASKAQSDHSSTISAEKAEVAGKKPLVAFGFTANYAAAVHENTEAKFQRPGAGAKFLQSAIQRTTKKMLDAFTNKTRIR